MSMLKAGNGGLRDLRLLQGYVSNLAIVRSSSSSRSSYHQQRHFLALPALSLAAEASSPEAESHAVAAKKTGRAFYVFVGVAAAAVLGSLAYPSLVTIPPPEQRSPDAGPPVPPTIVPLPSKETVQSLPPAIAAVVPTRLSPREELMQRVDVLQAELAELRKQKRSKLVDMKKRGIKDEIAMITDGLKKLDKA